jgi:lipopolysaccharide transport system permease protein/teichoic acid transport system permease protein
MMEAATAIAPAPPRAPWSVVAAVRSLRVHRRLIWQLALHELKVRYAATLAGALWAVVNPAAVILVFWFVSAYGLRLTFEGGVPFFLVLFCGLVPWMTFHEALVGGAGAVLHHAYLVKKIAFPLEILPVVSVVAATVVHGFLLALLVAILLVSGVWPTLAMLQAAYFLAALLLLTTSLAWIFAALNVFSRDVGQALGPVMTVWFWLTPIVWPAQNLSEGALRVVQLNPLFYVVEGYRNAFLYGKPLTAQWPLDLYFWAVVAGLFVLGAVLFQRLKPHFAEVL